MSGRILEGVLKKAEVSRKPSGFRVPKAHALKPMQEEEVPSQARSAGLLPGHDLAQITIHPATPAPGPVSSCPLPAGPRACPFGGACHTCPTQLQAKAAASQTGASGGSKSRKESP